MSGPCQAGHYCNGSTIEAAPVGKEYGDICPPGTYCVEGRSSPVKCKAGSYATNAGNERPEACLRCKYNAKFEVGC